MRDGFEVEGGRDGGSRDAGRDGWMEGGRDELREGGRRGWKGWKEGES